MTEGRKGTTSQRSLFTVGIYLHTAATVGVYATSESGGKFRGRVTLKLSSLPSRNPEFPIIPITADGQMVKLAKR